MQQEEIEHQFRITKIIWVIFLVSQISFLTAIILTKNGIFNFDSGKSILGDEPIVPIIFLMFAISNLAISFYLKSLSLKRARDEKNIKLVQTGTILGLAFCESIGIMGLILALVFNYSYFFIWFALAVFGILLHFPKRRDFPDLQSPIA